MVPRPADADPTHSPFLFLFKMTGHQKDRLQTSVCVHAGAHQLHPPTAARRVI